MISITYSREHALMVAIQEVRGVLDTDADFEEGLKFQRRLDEECWRSPHIPAIILCVSADYPRPNANWRRRFAELADSLRTPRSLFALVTPSAMLRGVMTILNWIKSAKNQTYGTFATFEEAGRWVEEERRQKLPILYELYKEALAKRDELPKSAKIAEDG